MNKWLIAVAVVAWMYSGAGMAASNIDGATLKVMLDSYQKLIDHDATLTQSDSVAAAAGIGYVEGVMDAGDGTLFCVPPISQRQLTLFVRSFQAGLHGKMDQQSGAAQVNMALSTLYPCKDAKR